MKIKQIFIPIEPKDKAMYTATIRILDYSTIIIDEEITVSMPKNTYRIQSARVNGTEGRVEISYIEGTVDYQRQGKYYQP